MKKTGMAFLTILLLLVQVGCNSNKLERFSDTSFDVGFNTPFSLVLYTKNKDEFEKYFEIMKNEVRDYNAYFDIYNDYEGLNNIKTINDNAGIKPVKVDAEIIEILKESAAWIEKTESLFDPTLGAVLTLWHDAREEGIELNREGKFGKSPAQEDLEDAYQYVGLEYLEIDEVNSTVYLNHERVSLDVGAIAKGWAVEKVAQTLEKEGITSGIVNGGGNVRLIGNKYPNDAWNVGITNPNAPNDSSLVALDFKESMSVVTSGDYERYFIDDLGQKQHHIINPRTLQPARYYSSVTVTLLDSGIADILSTPFSLLDLEDAKKYETSLNLDTLGLVFVKTEKAESDGGFNYKEMDGQHVYYNDLMKEQIDK